MFIRCSFFFFFNDTATTEIYTLSLHDALPICDGGAVPVLPAHGAAVGRAWQRPGRPQRPVGKHARGLHGLAGAGRKRGRSEEHTSELQSHLNLVCRLLLEKKKKLLLIATISLN